MTVGGMSSTKLEHCQQYANLDGSALSMTFNFHHLKVDYPNDEKWTYAQPDFVELKSIFNYWLQGMQGTPWINGATPILHSDQGWQYQMLCYRELCRAHGITPSMSRKGNCVDNGVMENFFGRLKTECYFGKGFDTFAELESTIHEYVHYYNHERIQMKLKGLSPVEYRT